MKIKHLLLFGWAAAMIGCTDQIDEELNVGKPHEGLEISIEGNINQQYHSRVDDGGFCGGDQIGLYGVNYTDGNSVAGVLQDKGNQVDNIRYTYDEENFKWTSSVSAYYKDENTHIDLYAYYPYGNPSSVTAYPFEVEKDQNDGDGYGASDFLWAKTENVVPSENKVKLHFGHKMSCVNVILTEGDGFADGEFDKLSKSVMVKNTIHTSTVDLSTGKVTATGAASNEGIVMMEASDGFRAIVVPQTMKATTVLFAITVDGVSYHYKKDVSFTYEAGKQSKFIIKVNKKAATGSYEFVLTDTEIVDWIADIETHGGEARQYFVVNQETPGTLGALIKANGKNPDKLANLKIIGSVDASDFYYMRDSMSNLQAVNMKECNVVEKSIPSNAFYEKRLLSNFVFPDNIVKIEDGAFCASNLTGSLIIPDGVVEIGGHAFGSPNEGSGHTDGLPLDGVLSLPNSLKKIGRYAFYATKLSGKLIIPSSVDTIEDSAFKNCTNFSGDLVLPDGLTHIGDAAFASCRNITGSLTIPDGIKTIGKGAFAYCHNLNGNLILPKDLQEIPDDLFASCSFKGELQLPEELLIIGMNAFAYNNFSGDLVIPEKVVTIKESAFYGCKRLSGILRIPKQMTAVHSYTFTGCSQLEGVLFSDKINLIGESAFSGCFQITSMVCNAFNPPVIMEGAFDGVAKDNFTLEVPESSVVKYQSSVGWNEFKRIAAHHEFSISRSLMRALNAEYSKEYILRVPSGLNWSIKSKPDWVIVTPTSGIGKAELTVTVNEMAATEGTFEAETIDEYGNINYTTYNGRAGEIVFSLGDKNYTSTMKVEQYNYEYSDGDVITHQTATEGVGVNLVFVGDCFDARDIAMGKYVDGINQAIDHFFSIEPYKSYKDYFNVYTVVGMSPDSGMGTVNTIRESKFGSQYTLKAGVAPDEGITFEYACLAPTVDANNINQSLVVMIENTQDYGGICYMWGDGSAIAVCPMSADDYPYDYRGIVQHEAGGHGFGKLADEYIYHSAFIESCSCICCNHVFEFNIGKSYGWYDNLSLSGDMNEVPWSHLIFHPKYSNIVDMYEGGYYHSRGVFRSEATSCMNNNIPYFSAISRQSIVERIMKYAGETFSLDDFYAKDVLDISSRGAQPSWDEMLTPNYAGASKQYAPKIMSGKPRIGK